MSSQMKPPPAPDLMLEPEWKLVVHQGNRYPYKSILYRRGREVTSFYSDTRWGARRKARRWIRQSVKPTSWTYEVQP